MRYLPVTALLGLVAGALIPFVFPRGEPEALPTETGALSDASSANPAALRSGSGQANTPVDAQPARPEPPPLPPSPHFADIGAATPEEIAAFNEAFAIVARHYPEQLPAWVTEQRQALPYLNRESGGWVFRALMRADWGLAMTFFEDGVVTLDRDNLAMKAIRHAVEDQEALLSVFEVLSGTPFLRAAEMELTRQMFRRSASPVEGFEFLLETDIWNELAETDYAVFRRKDEELRSVVEYGIKQVSGTGDDEEMRACLNSIRDSEAFDLIFKVNVSKSYAMDLHTALSEVPEGNSELRSWVLSTMASQRGLETTDYFKKHPEELDALDAKTRSFIVAKLVDRAPSEAIEYFAETGDLFEMRPSSLDYYIGGWASRDLLPAFEFYRKYVHQLENREEIRQKFLDSAETYGVEEILTEFKK